MNNLNSADLEKALNHIALGRHEQSTALIYRHYLPQLARYIYRLVWDVGVAQEIAHEALKTAFDPPGRYDRSCVFSTWLCGIARKMATAHRRKTAVAKGRFVDEADEVLGELVAEGDDPLETLERMRNAESVHICLERLPPLFREVLTMQHIDDMSTNEIAEELKVAQGTIKSRLHKARDLLRQCLSRRGMGEARP